MVFGSYFNVAVVTTVIPDCVDTQEGSVCVHYTAVANSIVIIFYVSHVPYLENMIVVEAVHVWPTMIRPSVINVYARVYYCVRQSIYAEAML